MAESTSEFASPNKITTEYFETLVRQVGRVRTAPKDYIQQEAMLAVLMGVTTAEVFMNLYFRVVVSEPEFKTHEAALVEALSKRVSFDQKIKRWPLEILGKKLPTTSPSFNAFSKLKRLRNDLVHFTSTHSTVHVAPNLIMHGLVDTSRYAELSSPTVENVPTVVLGFAKELMLLRGATPENISSLFHLWFGHLLADPDAQH